jgi:hypothetical protein
MKTVFNAVMRQAAQFTREQNVVEATRLIQRALSGRGHALSPDKQAPETFRLIEVRAIAAEGPGGFDEPKQEAQIPGADLRDATAEPRRAARIKRPLGEVLELLRQGNLPSFGLDPAPFEKKRKVPPVPVPVPDGAAYFTRTFSCEAGSRDYKVYVPCQGDRRKRALIIMLHGCTQLRSRDGYEPACGRTWLRRRLSGTIDERQSIRMLELV